MISPNSYMRKESHLDFNHSSKHKPPPYSLLSRFRRTYSKAISNATSGELQEEWVKFLDVAHKVMASLWNTYYLDSPPFAGQDGRMGERVLCSVSLSGQTRASPLLSSSPAQSRRSILLRLPLLGLPSLLKHP